GNMAGDLRWHIKNLMIGAPRNWAKNVLEWNLASDPQWGPHTNGGCTECLGVVTLDADQITRNPAYYIIAHASKFVQPGAKRMASNTALSLANVAFKNPDGTTVLLVVNDGEKELEFRVSAGKTGFTHKLGAGAVATLLW
ncbi:MAG TPA: glycoside hydrolase family 30 beta sandwich domain-containing protein, partial [Haliscomenobacter sp.]|nr:glycoside hydrolase family 30 beta sandwich domain-containing protein [Haliscomenobacter sp.]